MTDFKFIFLVIIVSLSLVWPQASIAQQYIDIDLSSPPKPKQQPKQPTTQPRPTPAKKPVAQPAARPRPTAPAAKKTIAPAQKPNPTQAAPTTTKKPAPTTPPVTAKPQVTSPTTKPQLPRPVVAPPPAQKPVATPAPRPANPTPQPPSQPAIEASATAGAENTLADAGDTPTRFKNRHGFTVDYTTWYETMKLSQLSTKSLVEANTHYFGISFNYDFTVYRENWGYAFTLGAITGNAQAGTKDAGDYYERRVVWTGFRGGGRLFWRANNRIDLGMGFVAQSKSTKWPEETNFIVVPQPNPHYFYYLDTRWRLNYRYELVQSFGTHLRSYALAWMLGLTYTLN